MADDVTGGELISGGAAESEPTGAEAVGLLTVVADLVRWRLLAYLANGEPTCVCDLQHVAEVAGNLLSYHLKVLREAGLVTTDKRGRWVYYSLADGALDRLRTALPAPGLLPPIAHTDPTSIPVPRTRRLPDSAPHHREESHL